MEKLDKPVYPTGTSKFNFFERYQPKTQVTMSTQLDGTHFDDSVFLQNLPQFYRSILRQFRRSTATFALFNACSILFFAAEIALFIPSLPVMGHSLILAVFLSAIFLSVFCYIVLLFYFQAKKPEQFLLLKDQFISSCAQTVGVPSGQSEHHQMIASALLKLASYLEGFEWQFYPIPRMLEPLRRPLSVLFALCHAQDVFRFSEGLLQGAIEEHLKQIRSSPTNLEAHASLANTYISLSRLYTANNRRKKELVEEKYRNATRLALEELEILDHYAPDDPWVHEMLAQGYHDLGMLAEESKEIEILLTLKPQDKELLFRIGSLYFKQRQNAKGLRIYEELKNAKYQKADELIAMYGNNHLNLSE